MKGVAKPVNVRKLLALAACWGMLVLLTGACHGARTAPGTGKEGARGLSVAANGDLLLNGRPYRGVGVNYFNAFIRTLDEGQEADTSYRR